MKNNYNVSFVIVLIIGVALIAIIIHINDQINDLKHADIILFRFIQSVNEKFDNEVKQLKCEAKGGRYQLASQTPEGHPYISWIQQESCSKAGIDYRYNVEEGKWLYEDNQTKEL